MALPLYYTHQLIIFIIIYNLKMNHIKPERERERERKV